MILGHPSLGKGEVVYVASLHPELTQGCQQRQRSREGRVQGAGCGWEYQCFQGPGPLCGPEGVKGTGLTRPAPLPPFRPLQLRSPSSGLHILCLGSSPHASNLRGAFAGAGQAPSTLALLLESPRGSVPCVFCCSRPLPTPVPQWVLKGSPHPHPHRLDSVGSFLPGLLDAVLLQALT